MKQSKKRWAFTEKQKRHDKRPRRAWLSVPRDYRRNHFVIPWKRKSKAILIHSVMKDDLENIQFPIFKKDAGYTYW